MSGTCEAGLRNCGPRGQKADFQGPQGSWSPKGADAELHCLWAGESGRDGNDRHLLSLGEGAVCAQAPCQREEAMCLSKNAGPRGGSVPGIPEGAGTLSECVRRSSGSPASVGEGIYVSVHLLSLRLPAPPTPSQQAPAPQRSSSSFSRHCLPPASFYILCPGQTASVLLQASQPLPNPLMSGVKGSLCPLLHTLSWTTSATHGHSCQRYTLTPSLCLQPRPLFWAPDPRPTSLP